MIDYCLMLGIAIMLLRALQKAAGYSAIHM